MWTRILVLRIALTLFVLALGQASANELNFSQEEQQWIDQQSAISVVADVNFYPYAFVNDAGEYDGISRDYLNEIAKLSGLTFSYQIGLPWLEMLQGFRQQRFDIIPMMFFDQEKTSYVNFSEPYLLHTEYLFTQSNTPVLGSLDELSGKTLAVVEGFEQTAWLKQRYPTITLKSYTELSHCLRAVEKGEVDATIGELSSSLYLKNKLRLNKIKKNIVVTGRKNIPISLGLAKQSPILLSVINKTLKSIDIETRNRISGQWLKDSSSQNIMNGAFGYGRAPYMYDQSSEAGLEYEIVRRVFSSMGYQLGNIEQLPTFRGEEILNEDQALDFSAGVLEEVEGLFYSDDIVVFNNVAISRAIDELELTRPSQLSEYSVTGFDGSKRLYSSQINHSQKPSSSYREHVVQEQSLAEFFAGEADILVADEALVKWAISYGESTNGLVVDYQFHDIFAQSEVGYKVAFRDERIRDFFNQALGGLKQSDSYSQLVELYMASSFINQIKRGNLIADVVAPYIFNNDIKQLRNILRVFYKNSNIQGVTVSSDSPNQVILQLQERDGELQSVDFMQVSNLSRLSKESFLVQNGSTDKVGNITFYTETNTPEAIISASVPDLSQFAMLSESELADMRLAYERHGLSGQLLNLSEAEQQWILENPLVKVAVDPAALPYEAFDSDGQYIGIVADYLQLISASTGIVFEPVKVESWEQSLDLIHQREVLLASAAFGNTHLELDYTATLPITKSEVSYVGRKGGNLIDSFNQLEGKTIGIIKGASQTDEIVERHLDVDWIFPNNTEQGIELVEQGEIDGMVDTVLVLNYIIHHRGYANLSVAGDFDKNVSSTLYVLKTQPLLQSIVSKAIAAVTQQQKDTVVSKWAPHKVVEKIDYSLVWQVGLGALILVVLTLFWNRRLATHIKAREQAELKLQAREQLLFDMLNSAPIGVAIVANDQTFFSNKTARDMFGVEAEDLDNFNVGDIYNDKSQREACYEQLSKGEPVVNQEIDFKRTDGSRFTGLANYLNTEFKEHKAVLFWCYDISELKELNTQLTLAIDQADHANRAKSDFLANMSHEIRTPMNAIIGMTHLALNADLDRKTRSYLNKVSHAAASLLGIINDILDFSKIEAGKLDMESLDICIQDILQNQLNLIELKAQEKGIEVVTMVEPQVPNNLMGDPLRLGQIFTNLASNAIKFTDQGEIVFTVKLLEQASDQAKLQFSVKDSGIGISPEQQQKLFQSFTQADTSTTREYGGTGLGLTICKRLVELMEGEIWINSVLGEGTEFVFTAWFKLNHSRPSLRNALGASRLGDMQILVVDDNESAADIMASIVSSFGPIVSVVHSGAEAQQLVAKQPELFDVAIVDWNMPDMDGVATCEAIRQEAGSHPIGFIIVSAYDHARFKQQSENAGVSAYLSKPITASEVFNAIARISGRDIELYTPVAKLSDKLSDAKRKLRGAHVLLVEDNELNQDLALELLNSIDVSCDLAENGQIAIDKLRVNRYDGVLMDIQMPVMDGYSATQKIREFDLEIVVIAMTANAMSGDREKVISAGMNDYISKPIDVETMITTMAQWIQASGIKGASASGDQLVTSDMPVVQSLNPELINQVAGLATCNGNSGLYLKLLTKFSISQQQFVEEFEVAVGELDWELATRLVHTLKGNSGNIGALALQDAAAELEAVANSIKQGELGDSFENSVERIQTLLANLATQLHLALGEIALLLPNANRPSATDDSSLFDKNIAQLKSEFAQLNFQLEECDADAVERIDELVELAFPEQIKKQLVSINRAAAEYDFEEAAVKLAALQQSLS
ncbi:transporter substrate-binding domain-containing protein [Agarivorans sp. 1_MG-2023]|uniref:response regulator n=1 Tax=Agarivorans sp. 1_MG-2023 TaxID=3062634 RepID=UPI0026E24CC5|nr:transporter substrate-binding domain-containing protein [Agarivorans sp. 1_MG-2023]MDO6762629.1 transporter substrate-binding domain-containing protein [Agarivorans sp. 1_MG-2023]